MPRPYPFQLVLRPAAARYDSYVVIAKRQERGKATEGANGSLAKNVIATAG